MAVLSYANAWAQLNAAVNLLQKTELYGNSASPNFETLQNTLRTATAGDYKHEVMRAAQGMRNALSAVLGPAAVRALLTPPLLDMARTIDAPERDYDGIMRRLYDYMVANSKTINSRGISYGSPSAGGSNTGNGSLYRVTVNADNYRLEGGTNETKTFLCVADQTTAGAEKHREVFEVRGGDILDDLYRAGSGVVTSLRCLDVRDSAALLRNPGFDTFSGTQPTTGSPSTPSTITSITGWTLDATTDVTVGIDTPAVYRTPVGETAAKWVRFNANRTMYQTLNSTTRAKFRRDVPYIFQVAVYRADSADGTLTIRVGNVSRAVTVSGLSNGAWNVIDVPDTQGQDCWYDRMYEDDLDIRFEYASRTTGSIRLDDIVFAPMTLIDGTFWALVGGATPFREGDTFTAADSEATRGINAYWLTHRAQCPVSLPSDNAAGETEADPS